VLALRSFADGPLIPLLSYVASCLGVFLGLRCATRARACQGASRGRWLLLAAVAIGSTGIWGMDFIALLGFGISGETTRYNVMVVIVSLLVAILAAGAGLLIIGVDRGEQPADRPGEQRGEPADSARALPVVSLAVFGLLLGAGLTVAHYLAMGAMRMPGRLSYDPLLVMLSFVLAVVAAVVLLAGAIRLRSAWATLGASLVVAVLLTAMHYTAMAAVHIFPASAPTGLVVGGGGSATASGFLLPVILTLSVLAFLICAAIALSPTEDAMRYDAALLDRIRQHTETPLDVRTAVLRPSRHADGAPLHNGTPVWNGTFPGQSPAPGQGTPAGQGTAGQGTAAGNGFAPQSGSALGNGFAPDDGFAPGDGLAPGSGPAPGSWPAPGNGPAPVNGPAPGSGGRRQMPPWALGDFPPGPDPH
jgi:NO-binding membrane sensor protein with MHYT domain